MLAIIYGISAIFDALYKVVYMQISYLIGTNLQQTLFHLIQF